MKQIIHITLCTSDKFQDVIDCQRDAIKEMQRKDFYFPSTPEELKFIFEDEPMGSIIGAYCSGHLIGFASVVSWTGSYYGYSYKSDCRCYSIEDTVVRAAYYGNGIQLKLWKYIIHSLPTDTVLMCTIHPENVICLRNAERLGFVCQTSVKPFGNSPRWIMERKCNS